MLGIKKCPGAGGIPGARERVGDCRGQPGVERTWGEKKRTRAHGRGKGSQLLEGHWPWGEGRMAMGASRGSQGMLWERESVG